MPGQNQLDQLCVAAGLARDDGAPLGTGPVWVGHGLSLPRPEGERVG